MPLLSNMLHTTTFLLLLLLTTVAATTLPEVLRHGSTACSIDSVCFSLDNSGSISLSEFIQEKNFVNDLATEIGNESPNTLYSAISFNTSDSLIQAPTANLVGAFIPAVGDYPRTGGGTDLRDGLSGCVDQLSTSTGSRVLVLLTDGVGNNKAARTVADNAKDAGITIVTVGIGSDVNANFLADIATTPELSILTTFADLSDIASEVAEAACVSKTPTPTPTPSPAAPCAVDVCYSIDSSRSITDTRYAEEQTFVTTLSTSLDALYSGTSYSAISFNVDAKTIQGPTTDVTTFNTAVSSSRRIGGKTDIAVGLTACADQLASATGNRVIILLTDGVGNNKAARQVAQDAKNAGITIVTVGIGSSIRVNFLTELASKPELYIPIVSAIIPTAAMDIAKCVCTSVLEPSALPSPAPGLCSAAAAECSLRFSGALKKIKVFRLLNRNFRTSTVLNSNGDVVDFGAAEVTATIILPKSVKNLRSDLFFAKRQPNGGFRFILGDSQSVPQNRYLSKCLRLEVEVADGSKQCAVLRINPMVG